MKKISRYFSIRTTMLIVSFCLPFITFAQGGGPGGNGGPGNCPVCPIDGGVTFLIAAGVGYGIKKIRDSRKHKEVEL